MIDAQFREKDEIAKANILPPLEDKVLFNVKTMDPIDKDMWG